jgi:hypothetical protein
MSLAQEGGMIIYFKQTRNGLAWLRRVLEDVCVYGSMYFVHYPKVIYTGSLADLRAEER